MDQESKLSVLLDLSESLGIDVRPGPVRGEGGHPPGGSLVKLRGKEILFLDTHTTTAARITAVAAALAGRDEIEQMFLPPEIREIIDEARERT